MEPLRVLEKEAYLEPYLGRVFRTLSHVYDEVFLVELVNVFRTLTIFVKKSSAAAVRHNPKYTSHIFLTIFTAVLLDCLK